jgi:dihydroorotase
MRERYDLVVKDGRCLTPGGEAVVDIGVRDGRIAAIGEIAADAAAASLDARGLHVLPGAIDTQVHFREPGNEHKEDIESGTRAAILGGVTAVFEMPNTMPPTIGAADLDDKLMRAHGRAWCDHAFFVGAAADNVAELPALEQKPGCAGVKMFMGSSTGTLLVPDDETALAVLMAGRRRMAVHAEDEERLVERAHLRQKGLPSSHPEWRDIETAVRATTRLIGLARRAGRRVHVLHVTTAEEMDLLSDNKDIATVETTPQHLTLEAPDCYRRLGTYAQMNPPIRDARHRAALWRAVVEGVVDVIGSDHAPHTHTEKERPYPESPSGMPGVQTLLPILLDHVNAGRVSLGRVVDLLAAGPQRIYGIAGKGRIARGYDADFAVVDLHAQWTITDDWIASKAGWTPFDGMKVTGRPVATILRGRIAMRDGEILGGPDGQPVRFTETL